VEVFFEVPEPEEAEFMDPTGVDPQLFCGKENASGNGRLGPFGLLTLASKDLTEQTAIFFRVFRGPSRYIVLMCSDQSRLISDMFSPLCSGIRLNVYAI